MPEIDLPTVIFALVALFVAWKLRSVLGMRQDSAAARRAYGPLAPRSRPGQRACRAAGRGALCACFAGSRRSLERRRRARSCGLERPRRHRRARIAASRREAFLAGARGAYDMVVHAFAAGDSDALKSLMSPEAFANFESAIHARANAGHTMSTTVVSIDNATIVGAGLVGRRRGSRAVLRQARFRNSRRARRSRRRIAQYGRRAYRSVDVRARCSLSRSQLAADGDRIRALSCASTLASPCGPASRRWISKASRAGSMTTIRRRFALSSARRGRLRAAQGQPRPAQAAPPELVANARAALCADVTAKRDARRFFETRFRPFRVVPESGRGFLTGYYEPCVPASRVETEEFRWPILARPTDLVTFGLDPPPVRFPQGHNRRQAPERRIVRSLRRSRSDRG